MPKNLYKKPRKKKEIQVVEGPVINPIKPPANNPGPNPPRNGGCPSSGGGGGRAVRVRAPELPPPPLRRRRAVRVRGPEKPPSPTTKKD